MIDKPHESVTKIADFIGVDVTSDSTLVSRVVEGSRFDNVKKAAQSILEAGAEGHIDHLRKGQIGDWRSHFSDNLFVEFENEIRQRLNGVTEEDAGSRSTTAASSSVTDLEYDIGGLIWKTSLKEAGKGDMSVNESPTDKNQGGLVTVSG